MDYLDFNGLQVYDEQIKSYINTVSESGIKIIPMNTAPTSSTLTYTIEGITYNFNVGDEVIVHDTTEGTEETNYYIVYKLYSIESDQLNTKSILEISTFILEKQLKEFKRTFYDRYKLEIAKMKKNLIDKNLKAVAIWEDFQNSLN